MEGEKDYTGVVLWFIVVGFILLCLVGIQNENTEEPEPCHEDYWGQVDINCIP